MMIKVRRLEDLIELADTHRPAFLSVHIDELMPGRCVVRVTAFSKYGVPVELIFEEECGANYIKMRQYLEAVFPKVYEGWIAI